MCGNRSRSLGRTKVVVGSGKLDGGGEAAHRRGGQTYRATVGHRKLLRYRQTQAAARHTLVEPLTAGEHRLPVLFVETGAVIVHLDAQPTATEARGHAHPRVGHLQALSSRLPSISSRSAR